jgi:hypothetical protein
MLVEEAWDTPNPEGVSHRSLPRVETVARSSGQVTISVLPDND